MNNILARASVQIQGQKHASYVSDYDSTKEFFSKLLLTDKGDYHGLKTIHVGSTFNYEGRSFKVVNIIFSHWPDQPFADESEHETLDLKIIVEEVLS